MLPLKLKAILCPDALRCLSSDQPQRGEQWEAGWYGLISCLVWHLLLAVIWRCLTSWAVLCLQIAPGVTEVLANLAVAKEVAASAFEHLQIPKTSPFPIRGSKALLEVLSAATCGLKCPFKTSYSSSAPSVLSAFVVLLWSNRTSCQLMCWFPSHFLKHCCFRLCFLYIVKKDS